MFEFLKELFKRDSRNKIKTTREFQYECNFQYIEQVSVLNLEVTVFEHSMNVYLSRDLDGLCKQVQFYPGYVAIHIYTRTPIGSIDELTLELDLRYDCTEEELFQLSTVYDLMDIDMGTIKLFRAVRDVYLI